jgi:electron transfer flavoprotein alpha subunit
VVKRSVFSGKAFAHVRIDSALKLISINPNSYKINTGGSAATVESVALTAAAPRITITKKQKSSNELLLTEAETVVSAGRGMKGPENWGMIEELANVMGAATACSRPVADAHWRPHNEHVGQTGSAIAPTLYIAIGISGAIQHLAGVNRSKVIVVINKDPEAPFFKAADYGIVGDAFEVVPALTAAVKKLKGV